MRVTATISGDLRAMLERETVLAAKAIRRGVEQAGLQVQEELREQVRANFTGGARLANAWRLKMYPKEPDNSLRPVAYIVAPAKGRANFANIVDAFEQGKPIQVRRGKYLAWPTP